MAKGDWDCHVRKSIPSASVPDCRRCSARPSRCSVCSAVVDTWTLRRKALRQTHVGLVKSSIDLLKCVINTHISGERAASCPSSRTSFLPNWSVKVYAVTALQQGIGAGAVLLVLIWQYSVQLPLLRNQDSAWLTFEYMDQRLMGNHEKSWT